MLLIDELDRADDEFEAFLLEFLSDFQVTIPEVGTVSADQPPLVIITSNRTRELHEALKRRCLYHWIDHPDLERELAIARARLPHVAESLAAQVCAFVQELRWLDLYRLPGVGETLDWAESLALSAPRSGTGAPSVRSARCSRNATTSSAFATRGSRSYRRSAGRPGGSRPEGRGMTPGIRESAEASACHRRRRAFGRALRAEGLARLSTRNWPCLGHCHDRHRRPRAGLLGGARRFARATQGQTSSGSSTGSGRASG